MKKNSKKAYVAPSMTVVELNASTPLLAGSSDVYSSYGIGYGGVDCDGEEDPD